MLNVSDQKIQRNQYYMYVVSCVSLRKYSKENIVYT